MSTELQYRKARANSSRSRPSAAIWCAARSHQARFTHNANKTSVEPPDSALTFNSSMSVNYRCINCLIFFAELQAKAYADLHVISVMYLCFIHLHIVIIFIKSRIRTITNTLQYYYTFLS